MKKVISVLLCLLLLFAFAVTANAEEGGGEGQNEEQETHTHEYGGWSDAGNGNHTRSCSCGTSESAPHTYGNWTESGEGHSRACSQCSATESGSHGWNEGSVTTQPTCAAKGVRTFACQQCGKTRTEEIAATGTHNYGNGVRVDDKQHTLSCSTCTSTYTENHDWDSGTVTTQATCVAAGVRTYKCTKCPETKTESISKLTTHTYGEWEADEVNHKRTCTVEGCGYVDSGKHGWKSEGYVIKAATCEEKGIYGYDCTGCDWTLTEEIPLADHTYDNKCDTECNVCEEIREGGHKFNSYRSYNSTSHWYACSQCKEKKDVADHVPGPAATEEKGQNCLTCGYEMMPKKNHEHDYSKNNWESDDTGHWHACKGCEVEIAFEEHTYTSDKCGAKCTVCEYIDDDSHTFDNNYESDKYSHWQICTVCKGVSTVEDHIPGPDATIKAPQLCTVCGYEIVPKLEHTHQGGDWLTNDTEHWRECECGEKLDLAIHNWDEGTKNKDKTVTHQCLTCAETKTVGEPQEKGGFPWWILLVLLILMLIGAVGMLIYILVAPKQTGKFSKK